MAKDKAKAQKAAKKHWWNNLADAYRITKRTYTWLPWALIGGAVGGLLIGVILSLLTHSWIGWMILGVMLALLVPMVTLSSLVRKASYSQLEGMPGASAAVLETLGRGWDVKTEPVRLNKNQDFVFRALGRPGVVLVAEGPLSRVRPLVEEERKAIKRVAPHAPVNVIFVGSGEKQTPLPQVEKKIRKLKKTITYDEVAALSRRLEAVSPNPIGIPKGIDPMKMRANRRALRG